MSLIEQVVAFFLWIGGTYAVGAAVGLYTYYKTGAVFYESGRSKAWRSSAQADTVWYMRLRKTAFTPGTVSYVICWALGYLLFGYVAWRVWLTPTVRDSVFGIVIMLFALLHWLALAANAWVMFGVESLAAAFLAELFNLAVVATMTGLSWKIFADGTVAFIGPSVSISIYAFLRLLSTVVVLSLLVRNRRSGIPREI